jgi:CubicO group peptidase (beta-lactamase class C family)
VWPTDEWPEGSLPSGVEIDDLLEEMWSPDHHGTTYATVIVHEGRLVRERYGNELVHWDRPNEPVTRDTPLLSWSMAKSMTHAAVGLLVGDGQLSLDQPASASIDAWRDDERAAITLDHLLCMRDGLDWAEDYVDAGVSNVIEMLFGAGQHDVAAYAEARPLVATPGERFNYSSGTTNIISGLIRRVVGSGDAYEAFLQERLFRRIGMRHASPRFDDAGTFVGSSYVYAPAREMARFGYLYLRDGVWDGERVLPEGWVDHGRLLRSTDPTDGRFHGAQWWCTGDEHGTYWASGYDGQSITISPALDLIVVRLGHSPAPLDAGLFGWRARVVERFAGA